MSSQLREGPKGLVLTGVFDTARKAALPCIVGGESLTVAWLPSQTQPPGARPVSLRASMEAAHKDSENLKDYIPPPHIHCDSECAQLSANITPNRGSSYVLQEESASIQLKWTCGTC